MTAHNLSGRGFDCRKRLNFTSIYPQKLALEEAKRLTRTAVAAGEEAISPTELGVWGPKTLEIGQNMGWHRGVQ